jgi:hypothetical protein
MPPSVPQIGQLDRNTHLFFVDRVDGTTSTTTFTPADPRLFSEVGLQERRHLQECLIAHPSALGGDIMVIASEYGNWSQGQRRLDILGLDSSGRLVVVELKRDRASGDVHLQALTYAALCSSFSPETLAEAHAQFLTSRDKPTTPEEALALIKAHCSDSEDLGSFFSQPRLIVVAGTYPPEVTATIVWLSQEYGMDISLIAVSAWTRESDSTLVIESAQIWPVAGAEDLLITPERRQADAVRAAIESNGRQVRAVRRLIESGSLTEGTQLRLVPTGVNEQIRAAITRWIDEDPRRGMATWSPSGASVRDDVLLSPWAEGERFTCNALLKRIWTSATQEPWRANQATAWWTVPSQGGASLAALASSDLGLEDAEDAESTEQE